MEQIELIEMNLHDVKSIFGGSAEIIRVPKGWIYRFFQLNQTQNSEGFWTEIRTTDSVFVPLPK